MSEDMRPDIIEASDEAGDTRFLKVEKYFYFNGEEYVLLQEVANVEGDAAQGEAHQHVMRVQLSQDEAGEEMEDLLPIEEGLMQRLIQTIQINYAPAQEDEDPARP
ncbi:MAG: hypothetical protein AB9880_06875 [Christensenellales bacterium]